MTERTFFSGTTVEQAVVAAAGHFGIDPEELAWEPVEKRHGFIRQRKRVVIRVDPDQPRKSPEEIAAAPAEKPATKPTARAEPETAAEETATEEAEAEESVETKTVAAEALSQGRSDDGASESTTVDESQVDESQAEHDESPRRETARDVDERGAGEKAGRSRRDEPRRSGGWRDLPGEPKPAEERFPAAKGEVAASAQRWLARLFDLAGLDLESRVFQGEERLEIEVSGPDQAIVTEGEAEVLLALQHLLPRLMHSDLGELLHCRIDCENFHEIREEGLRDLALRMAAEVRDRGRSKTLRPMHPADRRIVHLALADDPEVETESVGSGYFKRVCVQVA